MELNKRYSRKKGMINGGKFISASYNEIFYLFSFEGFFGIFFFFSRSIGNEIPPRYTAILV